MFVTVLRWGGNSEESSIVRFVTQAYEVGTYVAIYEDGRSIPVDQFGISATELEFHREIRETAREHGDEVLGESYSLELLSGGSNGNG